MSKEDKATYELTPKGWVEVIRCYLRDRDFSGAMDTCDKFDVWLDEHLVPVEEVKKGKKKK